MASSKLRFKAFKAFLLFAVLSSVGWGMAIIVHAIKDEYYVGMFPGFLLVAFGLSIGIGVYIGSKDNGLSPPPYYHGGYSNYDN